MTTILTVKFESDCTGTEFVGIREQDGTFVACLLTKRKEFKTLNGAKKYLRKFGYDIE